MKRIVVLLFMQIVSRVQFLKLTLKGTNAVTIIGSWN